MSRSQGSANLYLRRSHLFTEASSVVDGGAVDDRGVYVGLKVADPDAYASLMDLTAGDVELGVTLRAALQASRCGIPEPVAWANGIGSDKRKQDARLASAFGLSGAGSLFKGMRCCVADWVLGEVVIIPTRRMRGGIFERFDPAWTADHGNVVLSFEASSEDLGAAVRLCFERCL